MEIVKRRDRETIEWQAVCEQYREAKSAGWDGITERGHPLEKWVQKQRTLHHQGRLQDWKRKALREAHFDFVAPRNSAVKTNEQYAHELVAFYLQHGHWSPTQTVGGAGLTKWWKKMHDSGGKVGIVSQSSESAMAAAKILRERIPGFTFCAPGKSDINRSRGLSFNGFAKEEAKKKSRKGWHQDPAVQAALRHGDATHKLARRISVAHWSSDVEMPIYQLIERTAMFSQSVAVDVWEGDDIRRYWLVDVGTSPQGLISLDLEGPEDTGKRNILVAPSSVGPCAYGADGGRFETNMRSTSGERVRLSYDVFLADKTTRLRSEPLEYDPVLRVHMPPVDWRVWVKRRARERRHTAKTTSNLYFNYRLRELKRYVVEQRELNGSAYVPHLTWKDGNYHYKFIEHVLLKRRQGKFKFSHAERLLAVPVTWGQEHLLLCDLLGKVVEWR